MTEDTKPLADSDNCMGCHVTHEEIRRLGLNLNLGGGIVGPEGVFYPICPKCGNDGGVLAEIIAERLPLWSCDRQGRIGIAALFMMRDRLLMASAVDTFAARYSETNAVLNRQWGAINEVRKLLGLDAKRASGMDAKKTVLGALAGALIGAGLMNIKDPVRLIKLFASGAVAQAKAMGIEVPDLSALGL